MDQDEKKVEQRGEGGYNCTTSQGKYSKGQGVNYVREEEKCKKNRRTRRRERRMPVRGSYKVNKLHHYRAEPKRDKPLRLEDKGETLRRMAVRERVLQAESVTSL